MKRFLPRMVLWVVLMAAGGSRLGAEDLLFEDFSQEGALQRAPGFSFNGEFWVASGRIQGDGRAAIIKDDVSVVAGIDLGADYFKTNPGVYRLSMDVYFPEASENPNRAFGLAFTKGLSPVAGVHFGRKDVAGQPSLSLTSRGVLTVRAEPQTNLHLSADEVYPAGTPHHLELVLDTTGEKWTVAVSIDHVQLDLAGAGKGSPFVYDANPAPRCVAFSMNSDFAERAYIYNFRLARDDRP